jgi:hypothetical protein
MYYKQKRYLLPGFLLLLLFMLAACSPFEATNSNTTPNQNQGQNTASTEQATNTSKPAPTAFVPKQAAGTTQNKPGNAPIVINTPTSVPGGKGNSQQVALSDRTVVIDSVSKDPGKGEESPAVITIKVTVKNTGNKTIMNQATFFQLLGSGADFFGQANSSDDFYGPIPAHSARNGIIIFHVPAAAVTASTGKLRLMYRPEVSSQTVMMALNI